MYKYDAKIYGLAERKDNILKNKQILNLNDDDIKIFERSWTNKWPYKHCREMFLKPFKDDSITHRLVLQDDVELCPNFDYYLNKIIDARPDDIIMLCAQDYDRPYDYIDKLESPYVTVASFVSGCAVLIPRKYINDMFNWFNKNLPQIEIGNPHEDFAFLLYAKKHNINCITTVPSIAQHAGKESTLCNYTYNNFTYYFKDWEKANWDNSKVNNGLIDKARFKEIVQNRYKPSDSDEIKYFVRTTGDRYFDYSPLKYINIYDYEHKPIDSFIKALKEISPYNAVLMEDDLSLCKDFQKEIEEVIKKNPNTIINFFEDPGVWENPVIRSFPFEWNQCTYYPKGSGLVIARMMEKLRDQFPADSKLYSRIENLALINLKIPHLVYKPHLIQHNDFNTLLDHSNIQNWDKIRHDTIYFKDYLDEIGVPYNKAYTKETIEKLEKIRDKHLIKEKEKYDKKIKEIKEKD